MDWFCGVAAVDCLGESDAAYDRDYPIIRFGRAFKAAEAIRNEHNAPLAASQRSQMLGRVVCLKRKDN